jgi:basic membrane protein A
MRRYRKLIGALSVVALLAACGGGATATTESGGVTETTGTAQGPTFIYITPNPIGINKFLELGQIGTQRAAEASGGSFKVFESTDLNSRRANVEAAIEEAPDVIVLTTFEFTEMAGEFAPANPDQEFILIDACPETETPIENLHCGVFREHEGAYLLGLMAGNLTESRQIGSVVALDIPFLHRWSDSFALGAQTIDPSITDSQVFIAGDNPFSDPATAKEQALALAAQGADQIFAVGAGSNGGIFEAAAEEGFMTYGVDVNQCPDAAGSIVDNNLKLVDNVVEQLINSILDGSAEPLTSFGLAEGGTGVMAISGELDGSECLIADYPEIIEQVQTAADQIIDGSLEVPDPLFG